MTAEKLDFMMAADEARAALDISNPTMYRMVKAGKLPKPCKIGKKQYFNRAAFLSAVEKMLDPENAAQPA